MAYNNYDLFVLYLGQSKQWAENSNKSLYFDKTKLFSYGTWIADIRKTPSGTTTLFINECPKLMSRTISHRSILIELSHLPIRYWRFNESNFNNIDLLLNKIQSDIKFWRLYGSTKPKSQEKIKQTYQLIHSLLIEYQVPTNHYMWKWYHEMAFNLFANKLIGQSRPSHVTAFK